MNKYILEILKIQNSLILPGIGALMITNKRTGDIKLNPHLTFNDNALANFIAEKESIDKTEAQNQVSKFTREIKSQLDKGESYDIFEFGTIKKNDKDELIFIKAEAIVKPTSSVKEEKEKAVKPAIKKEVKKEDKETVVVSKDQTKEVSTKSEKTKKELKKDKVDSEAKAEKIKNTYIPPKSEIKKETKDKEVTEVPRIIPGQMPKSIKTKETEEIKITEKVIVEEKKKRRGWLWILLILLLLLIIGFIFRNQLFNWIGIENPWEQKAISPDDDDQDKIPNYADVDFTKGVDSDNDGIDDLFDISFTNGEDKDKDGIDDNISGDNLVISEPLDLFNHADEDVDGIPDFADVDFTLGEDLNENGIDDSFETVNTNGIDTNNDGIDDSLSQVFLLNAILPALIDEDNDQVPDYADVDITNGDDINNNGIDDMFENIDNDSNKDGLDDSLFLAEAERVNNGNILNTEMVEEGSELNESFEDNTGSELNENTDTEITQEGNNDAESEIVEEEILETESPVVSENISGSSSGKYHIVGGAFGEKSNAESYVNKLKAEGYQNAHIIGRFDGLHMVAIDSHQSREEANSNLSNYKSIASSAWVFKH